MVNIYIYIYIPKSIYINRYGECIHVNCFVVHTYERMLLHTYGTTTTLAEEQLRITEDAEHKRRVKHKRQVELARLRTSHAEVSRKSRISRGKQRILIGNSI